MRNRKTAQTTRARHVKNAHKSVGRRLSPAVSLDECRRKRLVVSGIQNPLCAGIRCGCGAAAGRKASPKPEGFWRGRIGNYDTKTKEHTEWCAVLCAPANLRFAHAFFSAAIRRAAVLLRKTKKRTSGIQNPALRRNRCECGAAAGRKASPKPSGFGGVRIGNYDAKRKTSIIDGGFLLVHLQGFEPGTH